MTYKTLSVGGVLVLAGVALLLFTAPLFVRAELLGPRAFCENLDSLKERTLAALSDRAAKAAERRDEHASNYETKRDERLAQLARKRSEADTVRAERYDALRERGETSGQQTAIEEFIDTVEELVAARREAIDAAVDEFEATVSELSGERDGATDTLVDDMTAMIDEAFSAAEASCEDSDPQTVRATLREAMQAMKGDVGAKRDSYSLRDDLAAAREARKAAFEAAFDAFKTDLGAAKATLKTSLGVE